MNNVIVCVSCSKRLYRCMAIGRAYAGDQVRAEDFVPVDADVRQPLPDEEMTCPFCRKLFGKPAVMPDETCRGMVFRLEDGSWWPSPPIKIRPKRS